MNQSPGNLSSVSDGEISIQFKPTVHHGQAVMSFHFDGPPSDKCDTPLEKNKLHSSFTSTNEVLAKTTGPATSGEPHEVTHIFKESNSLGDLMLSQKKMGIQPTDTSTSSLQTDIFNLNRKEGRRRKYSEGSQNEIYGTKTKRSSPGLTVRVSDDLKRDLSVESGIHRSDTKESEMKPLKEEKMSSSLSDIIISKRRHSDDPKKMGSKRGLLQSKPVTISLTFDAFVDQMKGREFSAIASNYPDYKIDKRLIFLGKEVDYPWHVISYHSTFRKLWNLFILAVITYEIFWYPLAATFIYDDHWPSGSVIFEIISVGIFLLDMIINIRTTYSNENNEEIIDSKMMRNNYMRTKLFFIDAITTLPIPEVLLLVLFSSSKRWIVYSLSNLVRMLRVFKIGEYLHNRLFSVFAKLLRIFITFFIIVHWVSCLWYIMITAEYDGSTDPDTVWIPNTLRMLAGDMITYYNGMNTFRVYGLTLLSVFMLAIGSDMAPSTNLQIWFSVGIGLFGAVGLAYIFGLVTLIINRANQEASLYQQQLEELKHKLRINKIPHNLKVKVMEYFYYSWRKHNVLKKVDDFSELSIPLQRDIALYQHQEMISKVPLFKELDPVEILSIIQKLKTSIYMPGDKIIREGERGTEMFFIQEGSVEMLVKKSNMNNRATGTKYDRTVLERGSYFGEVALMSNSKRNFDVNAFEFCILYTFSRSDYESLKAEFKDIGPRLRSGLKHYKNTHMSLLIQILQKLEIFKGFTPNELQRIGDEYLEELFVDPDRVILDPKERTNSIYIMLNGAVNCYTNNEETRNYLNNLKRSNDKDNWTIVDPEEEEGLECLDDDILHLEKDKHSIDDQKNKLDLVKSYTNGDYFGTLDFDVNEIKCDKYYITDTGCQIGAITQSLKSQMANEDPELYEKLRNNIIKCTPKRVMVPIEEESDSSFTTKNNTFLKARVNRRTSNFSDLGKKAMFIKSNKKDDVLSVKEELQQLEEEMMSFKTLIAETNAKLFRMVSGPQGTGISEESTPEKRRRGSNQLLNVLPLEKIAPKKYSSNVLIRVDEVNIEESRF